MSNLGWVAADEIGIVLKRTAVVPNAGRDWTGPVAALLDGFDMVVVAVSDRVSATTCQQFAARARQRGSVLVPYATAWHGVEVTLTVTEAQWDGVGEGAGSKVTVHSQGRGSAVTGRQAEMWMPAPAGWQPERAATMEPRPALRAVG